MGAQRWIDFGVVRLQPSEMMKVALILALARYFHGLSSEEVRRPLLLLLPTFMALTPAALVMKQPDLGTAGMLLLGSGAVFFCAGVRWWKFALLLRSEEHTSELLSLMRISYAVFCLKTKKPKHKKLISFIMT